MSGPRKIRSRGSWSHIVSKATDAEPAKLRDIVSLNAKNRSEKGFKMHNCLQIWGWFLPKKIDLPTQGGRSGNFRGSKNQKSGKCHELSRKSIKFVFTHPTRGGGSKGGWG